MNERKKAIIASLAFYPDRIGKVSNVLKPVMFDGDLRKLADFMWSRFQNGKRWDEAMLKDIAGAELVQNLHQHITGLEYLIDHANAVSQGYLSGQLAKKLGNVVSESVTNGIGYYEMVGMIETERSLLDSLITEESDRMDLINETEKRVFDALDNPEILTGIPTPWDKLNRFNCGWQPGDLVYIAGRAGMGKTTVLCEIALAAAQYDRRTAIFTMADLSADKMIEKLAAILAAVNYSDIRTKKMDADKRTRLRRGFAELRDLPLYVFDPATTPKDINTLKETCYRLIDQHDVELFLFDYVQQLRANERHGTENDRIGEISAGLQHLAKRTKKAVIAGAQLSRAPDLRGGSKRPQLSDLRGSGNLEQDADSILFPYRPEYYEIKEDEKGNSTKGIMELIALKDRLAGDLVPTTIPLKMKSGQLKEINEYGYDDFPEEEPANTQFPIPAGSRPAEKDEVPF